MFKLHRQCLSRREGRRWEVAARGWLGSQSVPNNRPTDSLRCRPGGGGQLFRPVALLLRCEGAIAATQKNQLRRASEARDGELRAVGTELQRAG